MRFVCISVEHLPIQVEKTLCPSVADRSLIIVRAWDDRVIDISPDMAGSGINIGDTRRRAEQLGSQAITLPSQETLYLGFHDLIKSELRKFADAIEDWSLGFFFIAIDKISQTFPSEKNLGLHITASLQQPSQLLVTAGIAGNKFTALLAAKAAQTQPGYVMAVPAGKEKPFLAEFPLTVLPDIPLEMLRRLHLFGITTLGGLAQLPRPAVTLQFGSETSFFLDLARGIDTRPLTPQSPPPIVQHTKSMPETVTDRNHVMAILDHMSEHISTDLAKLNCHTTALSLTITDEVGKSGSTGTTIKPPSGDIALLQRAVARLFGKLHPVIPISSLCVTAYPLREWHAGARQLSLFSQANSQKWPELRRVISALKQRFGEAVIQIASAIGPPLPLPIRVHLGPQSNPTVIPECVKHYETTQVRN